MQSAIELKHVGPKAHVRQLLEDLIGRLEAKLSHVRSDAISMHVVFEENGSRTLYRTSLTCHIPGHLVAAHEERRDAGLSIRKAFAELERQLEKLKVSVRRERLLQARSGSRRRQAHRLPAGRAGAKRSQTAGASPLPAASVDGQPDDE